MIFYPVYASNPAPSDFVIRGGVPCGFMDFEMAERNVWLYDPCYAATSILSKSFERGNESKLAVWLELYRQIIFVITKWRD